MFDPSAITPAIIVRSVSNLVSGLVAELGQRLIDQHEAVDTVDVQKRIAMSARHRGVDLGDHQGGGLYACRGHIDRNAKADVTACIRRRDLDQGHIHVDASVCEQLGDLRKADRHVFEPAAGAEVSLVAPDEEGTMTEAVLGAG